MKQKPNITLKNIADTKNIGFFLSVKKGINEILNRRIIKNKPLKTTKSCYEYPDFLSVIICTTGNTSLVKKAVKSIVNQDFPKDKYEIIVVNNSTYPFDCRERPACRSAVDVGTGVPDSLQSYITKSNNIKIINEPVLGLSKARNTGAKEAKGEYILYIDDDATANPRLLSLIYSGFKEHKNFAIIGGQIFLKLPIPTPDIFLENHKAIWSSYTVPYKHFREAKEHYEFPYGACFAIRHSFLDVLGGFSEKYGRCGNDFAGGEETALCFKAQQYGFKIGIEPKASVLHCVGEHRFTEEHVKKTIRMGILTTYRLCKDGYTPYLWTKTYIKERIRILNQEIKRLKLKNNYLAAFYKECELSAFEEIAE